MGAALSRGNQVDVAFLNALAALRQPEQCPVHRLGIARQGADERLVGQAQVLTDRVHQVGAQAVLVVPLDLLAGALVLEADAQPRAEHGLGLEHVLEPADGKLRRVEILGIGPEAHAGAGVALADAADHFQITGLEAVGEAHAVLAAIALDGHLDTGRQRVDHGDADPVQTTGKLVVLVGKLAARVQLGEDQLDTRHPFLGVNVHRHAAAVVDHFQRVVLVQDHLDRAGMPGKGFVDTVVDDFLGQVIGPRGVGVHARALAHRIEAGKNLDGFCGIRHLSGTVLMF